MAKITLPGGLIVEVASPKEAAQFLREFEAFSAIKSPAPAPPATSVAQSAVSAQNHKSGSWTPKTAREFVKSLPEKGRKMILALVEAEGARLSADRIAQVTGVEDKRGLGSVARAIEKGADEAGSAAPMEKDSRREGKARVTEFWVTQDFLNAYRREGSTP